MMKEIVIQKKVGQFQCYRTDGTPETIVILEDFYRAIDQYEAEPVSGSLRLRTPLGLQVNRITKGEYEIRDNGERIPVTSDDPNAF